MKSSYPYHLLEREDLSKDGGSTTHSMIMAGAEPASHESVQVGSLLTVIRERGKVRWEPDSIFNDEWLLPSPGNSITVHNQFPRDKLT